MTQRSILAGDRPDVVVKAGANATVEVWDSDRVLAVINDRWGLKVERRGDLIEVKAGGTCHVRVPRHSRVTVYAGKSAEISGVRGELTRAEAGGHVTITGAAKVAPCTAGGDCRIEGDAVIGDPLKFTAGRDLRFQVRDLANTRLLIHDLGGKWEVGFGDQSRVIRLQAGRDAILVTSEVPAVLPPLIGSLETPETGGEQ